MSWYDHPLFWKSAAKKEGAIPNEDYVQDLIQRFLRIKEVGTGGVNTAAQVSAEVAWTKNDRPYYDLYPSVVEAFTKVDLNKINCEDVKLPLEQLMIRMKVGHELQASPRTRVRSILVSVHPSRTKNHFGLLVSINDGTTMYDGINIHTVNAVNLIPGTSVMEHLINGRENRYCDDPVDDEAVDTVYKLVVALCLLKDNPDLIEPEPLEADKLKWEATHDPKLIEKAAKRGKRAWAVGKRIEVAPGFRRPHFAIRWMGKGGNDPRLRPIKGCLVNRRRIEEVPTDWLGPELEEMAK